MRLGLIAGTGLALLAACGDPLANVERIGDVELATQEPVAQALPAAEEVSPEGGFFSRVFRNAPGAATPEAAASLPEAGAETVATTDTDAAVLAATSGDDAAAPVDEAVAGPDLSPEALVEPEKRRGLFGLGLAIARSDKPEAEEVRTASLSPDVAAPEARAEPAVSPRKRTGLFGPRKNAPRTGPDARDVNYGETVPFGEIARVCGASRREMGRKIGTAGARGKGYTLYDSAPDTATQRTFYVTGFSDDCPRQFTAALALFGAPSMHEQLRYGRPADEYPYSTTDKAYEKVKSKICGAAKRKPCGAAIGKVEKNTVFISTYEKFGGNARWADILLHDGATVAAALKIP